MTYFSLFSLFGYSPALQTGAFGLLMLLNGVVSYLEDGQPTAGRMAMIALGGFIALLSKPEPAVATAGVLFLLIVFEPGCGISRWKRPQRSILLLLICSVPALLVYGCFLWAAGAHTVAASVTGFGLATKTCPYWPTGIGIWAMLAGLGAALTLIAFGSASRATAWRTYLGAQRYRLLCFGAVIGLGFYLSYEIYARAPSLYRGAMSGRQLRELLYSMASTTDTFRAALWPAALYWIYLLVRGLRQGGRLPQMELKQLVWFTVPVLMSARSLFSTVLSPFPEIPAICYPFVALSGPYLLYQALITPVGAPKGAALRLVAVLTLAYIALRLMGGYPGILSNRGYSQINTPAGEIKINDGGISAQVCGYVMKHTSPADGILEVPYGGGISFASGRRSPLYSTLFVQISPPEGIQRLDLERIRRSPPAVVIARGQPNLGTYFGVETPVGCEFPRIVWKSEKRVGDRDYVLPIVEFIRKNYRMDQQIGEWQLWRPK